LYPLGTKQKRRRLLLTEALTVRAGQQREFPVKSGCLDLFRRESFKKDHYDNI